MTAGFSTDLIEVVDGVRGTGHRPGVAARYLHHPVAVVAALYLLAVVAAVVAAPLIAPYGPDEHDLLNALSGPSSAHPLGAGELGRDVLSRLLYGGRTTLLNVAVAVVVFGVLGVMAGLAAGYLGGRVDKLVLRVSDVVYATPTAIILLVVIAVYPNQHVVTMVVLGVLGSPSMARVVRSVTRGVSTELYVSAARASGLGSLNIMRRHVLPLLAGPIIVQLTLFAVAALGLETALGFLGLGPPGPSWGGLVAESSRYMGVQPWLLVPAGLNIVLFVVALGLAGDGVRDSVTDALHGVALVRRRRGRAWSPPEPRAVDAPGLPTFQVSANRFDEGEGPYPAESVSPLLVVRGLSAGFDGPSGLVPVVRDVSFHAAAGRSLGIVGESGCGKTLTVLSILGLLPDGGRVLGGDIEFDRVSVAPGSAAQRLLRGRRIGWIPQQPVASLDPSFSVESQLCEVVRLHGGAGRAAARARAFELLQSVGFAAPESVAHSYPHQLSGGMAQRVAIALALAGEPDLLIADEPTTALDVTVQAEVLDLLHGLVSGGMGLVIVTHNWGVVADLCDDALVMYAGEVVEYGSAEKVSRAPAHPYTAALLSCSPHGVAAEHDLPTIPGRVPDPSVATVGCRFAPRCAFATSECAETPVLLSSFEGDRVVRCARAGELAWESRA